MIRQMTEMELVTCTGESQEEPNSPTNLLSIKTSTRISGTSEAYKRLKNLSR
jgi:hypothetical protein